MIIIFAGPKAGEKLIRPLKERGYTLCTITATELGVKQAIVNGSDLAFTVLEIIDQLCWLKTNFEIELVIDHSGPAHSQPFSFLLNWFQQNGFEIIKYHYNLPQLPDSSLLFRTYSWEELADRLSIFGPNVFLTTGSNNIEFFLRHPKLKEKRFIVRVIPDSKVVEKCIKSGIEPQNLIAMMGPFSARLNKALFQSYKADVIVAKENNAEIKNKAKAAFELGIPLLVLSRQVENAYTSIEDILNMLNSRRICYEIK